MAVLTDQQIAVLCDVGDGRGIAADHKASLDVLIANGFAEASDDAAPTKYRLTGKGQQFLAERGAGLNEA